MIVSASLLSRVCTKPSPANGLCPGAAEVRPLHIAPERICGVSMVCDASELAAVLQSNQSPRRQGTVITVTHDCATATQPLSALNPIRTTEKWTRCRPWTCRLAGIIPAWYKFFCRGRSLCGTAVANATFNVYRFKNGNW